MGGGYHWLLRYDWDCSQLRSEASRLAAIPHGLMRAGRLRRVLGPGNRLDRLFVLADLQQGSWTSACSGRWTSRSYGAGFRVRFVREEWIGEGCRIGLVAALAEALAERG